MPQEQMPERIWVGRLKRSGALEAYYNKPIAWYDDDQGSEYARASSVSALAERVERAEERERGLRADLIMAMADRDVSEGKWAEADLSLTALREQLERAEALLKEVQVEFSGSCKHCAYWNWQSNGLMTRLSSFLHDGTKGDKP